MKKNRWHSIILVAIIFIAIASVILPRELNDLDEIWNFNFAKNVSDGRVPYRDFNIVSTPLLSMICGLILKIVGKELIVTRILAVILHTAIFFVVYKILEQLKINRYYRYVILFIIYEMYKQFFCLDYNFSVLLIALIIILLEIRKVNNTDNMLVPNFKYDFFLGILAGTTILFKQTTGIAVSFIYAFYKIILIATKEDFKQTIKIILARISGICVPILLFVIYLLANNAWVDFLDYAIYGIKTFSNKISYMALLKNYGKHISILSIILPLTIIYSYFKIAIKENKKKEDISATILCAFSVASFIVAFPISDSMHFLVGAMPAIILLIFLTYEPIKKLLQKPRIFIIEFMKISTKLMAILTTVICVSNIYTFAVNCNKYKELEHFYYIPSNATPINSVGEYVLEKEKEGKKVYILEAEAAIYMIPINRYNKNYDMFLKGAIGSKGEEGQIENLNNEENIEVLILKDKYMSNWQTPETVIQHIKNNWIKTGEIYIFDIYNK